MLRKAAIYTLVFFASIQIHRAQDQRPVLKNYDEITTGAARTDQYLSLLQGLNVGIVAHKASRLNQTHLVDSLLARGVHLVKIFSPEHGFRGEAEAGESINSTIDNKTLLPLVSLYGKNKKPTDANMKDIDIMLFDLQDVGVRFYTYISTLTYVMEACAAHGIPLVVLDRPNPNGFYVDGPVLEPEFTSFVGMHPVPIVYGLTIGEYALMVNGERWLHDSLPCRLTVIPLLDYTHNCIVKLQTEPSPNLPNWRSVYLYPSLCLFEGTIMSVGRGTDLPFEVIGHPDFYLGSFIFSPRSIPGKSSTPKYMGKNCYGQNLSGYAYNYRYNENKLNLSWLIGAYQFMMQDHTFFNDYFDTLAGTDKLRKQIISQSSEYSIRKSWEEGLAYFRSIREKYLLYE